MRKKCDLCGLICFDADERCRRCDSDRLSALSLPGGDTLLAETADASLPRSKKLKFVKYFIFMIFAQIGLLGVTAMLGVPFVFHIFYEPVFIVVARFMRMGHADVIMPLLLIASTFFAYAAAWSYLLVYSRFREAVFLPVRRDVGEAFTSLRAKINAK